MILALSVNIFAQNNSQKIYETEKAFEKAVAEKGMNQAFVEFTTTDATCFMPGYPVNCQEFFKSQSPSTAALNWNPVLIDVSTNGAIAYSIGNSVYRAKGKDDPQARYGEYLSIWMRQPDGSYKAVLDTGINYETPNSLSENWTTPADSGKEPNEKRLSAADSSTAFFETATKIGRDKAYKSFLAEDARLMREGMKTVVGKKEALNFLKKDKTTIAYAKRSTFSSAADMAYTSSSYTLTDKSGKQIEKGNFVQVWKLRNGQWQIVLDFASPAQQ